jgi:hypothetical protein
MDTVVEVLTAVVMNSSELWDIMLFSLAKPAFSRKISASSGWNSTPSKKPARGRQQSSVYCP